MKTYTFKVVVEPDEDRWHAYCPALLRKGGATWGYTEEEALKNIQEALELYFEDSSGSEISHVSSPKVISLQLQHA